VRRSKVEIPQIPDRIRFINLYGVSYYIKWEALVPGASFFLLTTAHRSVVQKELKPAEQYFRIVLRAVQRCEYGHYGVRVWRLS